MLICILMAVPVAIGTMDTCAGPWQDVPTCRPDLMTTALRHDRLKGIKDSLTVSCLPACPAVNWMGARAGQMAE